MRLIGIGVAVLVGFASWPVLAECVAVKYRDTLVCLDTFVCTETPQDSVVREVCFDAAKYYMLIKLDKTWYHYCSVDHASVGNLIKAPSIYNYYKQHFRSHGSVHGPIDCRGHPVTSNGGVMLLAMAERRLGLADKLALVFPDRRDPPRVLHSPLSHVCPPC